MPGTPNFLILPSDTANTGKELQTWSNSISGQTVNTEAVTLTNSSGVEEGTSSNPVRIDPTGTTTQPVQDTAAAGFLSTLAGTVSGGVQANNITEWGGTAVTAPPASGVPVVGTEVAPVVKTIARKSTTQLTTTVLAANGTFTSAWFDTNATGDNWVEVTSFSAQAGASAGFSIQGSDDSSNANFTKTLYVTASESANTLASLQGPIPTRYWRVVYVNGATLQTSFELNATSSNSLDALFISQQNGAANQLWTPAIIGSASISDGAVAVGVFDVSLVGRMLATCGAFTTSGAAGGTTALARTPNIFHTASVPATASGNTAIWTPTSGKKFRLMRFQITAQDISATAATTLTISLQDSSTAITIGTYDVLMPAVANLVSGIMQVSAWVDLGNGYLSSTANNVLNANISATVAGATGTFRVNVCGTEE